MYGMFKQSQRTVVIPQKTGVPHCGVYGLCRAGPGWCVLRLHGCNRVPPTETWEWAGGAPVKFIYYRDTSLMRKCHPLGLCTRIMPRDIFWPQGVGLMSYEPPGKHPPPGTIP